MKNLNEDINRIKTMMGLIVENENETFDGDSMDTPNDEEMSENPWEDMPELPTSIQANKVKGTTTADEWMDYILMKLDYKKDNDYRRTQKMFGMMDEDARNLFEKLVDWKVDKLYGKLLHDVRGVSDDGFSDLVNDIISRGTEFFNKVMEDPSIAQKMVDDHDYQESFSYTFNLDEENSLNEGMEEEEMLIDASIISAEDMSCFEDATQEQINNANFDGHPKRPKYKVKKKGCMTKTKYKGPKTSYRSTNW